MALSSAGLARGFLQEHWCAEHDSADLAQAQLIVTELVTNAVRHGGPPIELQVECLIGGGVMLSVSDGTPDVPMAQAEDHARWGGHGVALVDLLSAEWGVKHVGRHVEQQHPGRQHSEHQLLPVDQGMTAPAPPETPPQTLAKTVWCRLVA